MENIGINLRGIGHALKNQTLIVPHHQRSYSWEEKHVQDLLDDITIAKDANEPEYFLGSIVTMENEQGSPRVVDGQQRLATVTILMAKIRDYFATHKDDRRAQLIDSGYLQSQGLVDLERRPKLQLNIEDNSFFESRILAPMGDEKRNVEPSKYSHAKLVEAAGCIERYIGQITQGPNATDHLTDLVSYLTNNVKVIWVSVSDDVNAYKVFETLNDRGLSLAISDLLKNYLFGRAHDRLEQVQEHWSTMLAHLESLEERDLIVTYIRHLWCSKEGIVREKRLYPDIKQKIRTRSNTLDLSHQLASNARIYSAILDPGEEFWGEYGPKCREHMQTLNFFRMSQIRPLVSAVLDEFSAQDIQETLRSIVAWGVRFMITGGVGGGTLEKYYSEKAQAIRKGKIEDADNLREAMRTVVPTDKEFRESFKIAKVSKQYLARYYLRALEQQRAGEDYPELIPNPNKEVVNLEHILPRNPSGSWDHFEEHERDAFVNRIGNLAIMGRDLNEGAANASFSVKKSVYQNSSFQLTSDIAEYDKWDVIHIEERQEKLADLAVGAWSVD